MPPSERGAVVAPARAFRYDAGASGPVVNREVAEETSVEIVFGGAPFAVMMATPLDLEDFVYGFALTEAAIGAASDIRAIEVQASPRGVRVEVSLTGAAMSAHLGRKRAFSGRTGCGVCGVEDLTHLPQAKNRAKPARKIAPKAIGVALAGLEASQPLNARTRAVHAAAWCGVDGAILCVREDVGRHNALDKLIGALLREGANPEDGFVLITSRCSFEMVVKTAALGAGTLVSVSAPTSLALETAAECGIDLIAVARADGALAFESAEIECGVAA